MTTLEETYRRLEAEAEEKRRAKMRRQPLLLVGLVGALVLGIGITAAIDLRRLATPGGTALTWTQAAVFGDCDDYLEYSVADGLQDTRSPEQLCRDLRSATADARATSATIGLTLGQVQERGDRAEVAVTLVRDRRPQEVRMRLVRTDDRWRVVRDTAACAVVGCA